MDNASEEVILQHMHETRTALADKLETLEHQVADTVHSARAAVTDTVTNVQEAVHETVGAIKDTFDLPLQVQRHPWLMMAASVATGYVGARLLERVGPERIEVTAPTPQAAAVTLETLPERGLPAHRAERARTEARAEKFEDELNKLKGLALGTMLGVARDLIVQSAPPQLAPQLEDVINSFTTKVGGEVIRGPLITKT